MGGGGALKTAANIANIGLAGSVSRVSPPALPTVHSISIPNASPPSAGVSMQLDGEPIPSALIDAVPTIQDAMESINELTEDLDTWSEYSSPGSEAYAAYSFIQELQRAVASVASDMKVWDAVSLDPEVKKFMQSQKKDFHAEETKPEVNDFGSLGFDDGPESDEEVNGSLVFPSESRFSKLNVIL